MTIDWNLLPGLHALLEEASVSRAAARIGVTVPSMSRMLGRLRAALGDPLLVRAGRGLVPTAYAASLRERVARLTQDAQALLAGGELTSLRRTLVIRTNDGLSGPWLEPLVRALRERAPELSLAFVSEGDERPDDLRDGRVDLDVGVVGDGAPELRTQVIARDRFVAVVRRGHPLLAPLRGKRALARYAGYDHLGVSRRGRLHGPVDAALRAHGLERRVVASVPTATAAAVAAAGSDWVAGIPLIIARSLAPILPIAWTEIPLALPPLIIAQTWHPRLDRDPAHRLLRDCVRDVARQV